MKRILSADIRKFETILLNQEIDVILTNGIVYHGYCKKISTNEISIQNLRLKNHIFELKEVEEIITRG